jgi:hypothetical protein
MSKPMFVCCRQKVIRDGQWRLIDDKLPFDTISLPRPCLFGDFVFLVDLPVLFFKASGLTSLSALTGSQWHLFGPKVDYVFF